MVAPAAGAIGGVTVTPIMYKNTKHKPMTSWKSGLEFQPCDHESQQQPGGMAQPQTTSRLRKVATLHNRSGGLGTGGGGLLHPKKGNFQIKNRVADAPDLLMVVNARPEMKERATAEAKARHIKIEEQNLKKMRARLVVSKPSPKQAKPEWTNVLKSSKRTAQKGRNGPSSAKIKGESRKKGRKPPAAPTRTGSGTTEPAKVVADDGDLSLKPAAIPSSPTTGTSADWNAAYEDVVSPKSGILKSVAKQDLSASEKVTSPKKKARRKNSGTSPTSFPDSLPLVDYFSSHHNANENSGEDTDDTMSRDSSMMDDIDEELLVGTSAEQPLEATSSPTIVLASPPKKTQDNIGDVAGTVAANTNLHVPEPDLSGNDGGFVDLSEYQDQSERNMDETDDHAVGVFVDTRLGTKNEIRHDDQPPEAVALTPPQNKRQHLILEFTVPGVAGNGGYRGGDYGEECNDVGLEVPVEVLSFDDMSSVDSWPSIDSDDSYDTKMNKMMQRWVDVNGGYDNHRGMNYVSENYADKSGHLDDNVLDHIVLAAPDLEKAMEQFEQMTGIMPTHVGPLQGLGAKTAHVGLDHNRYIEILAPDLDNPGPLGDELKTLEEGTLAPYHYSIRSSDVSRLIEGYVYDVLGWDPDHIAMVQALPDNSMRQWDLLTMYGHDMGGCAPYYVKWNDPAQHPTSCIPLNATLAACTIHAPENHDVHKLIAGVGGINVEFGDPMLECSFDTPKGTVTFSASRPKGLIFPGYDDEHDIDEPMPDLPPASEVADVSDWVDRWTQN